MYLHHTAFVLACLFATTTSTAGSQAIAFRHPFRYFKLQDNSNATIVQQIKSTSRDTAIWRGGPSITAGESRPLWPPKRLTCTAMKLICSVISYLGGFYWTDLADETDNYVVKNSSYRFGARALGENRTGSWDPNVYEIDFRSDYEALFVYDGHRVRLDSIYVKFQDGKKV